MIKRLTLATLISLVSGSVFAGGGFEPEPLIFERPPAKLLEPITIKKAPVATPEPVVVQREVRDDALFVGTFSSVEFEDINNLGDFDADVYYVKYSRVVSGFTPVGQVIFGDGVIGAGAGIGYGFYNLAKPYVTIDGIDVDNRDDLLVSASLGVNIALPYGAATDLGITNNEDDSTTAYIGLGYRW